MDTALTIRTTVQTGGRIEVDTPDLPAGQAVEVTVRPVELSAKRRSILEILSECNGGALFKTAEEVDAYINEERDAWDR